MACLAPRTSIRSQCSPHTFGHPFARGYLVHGGDVFSLQQILGHTTLDLIVDGLERTPTTR